MGKVSIQAPSFDFQLASICTADGVISSLVSCGFHTQNCTTCSSEMLQEAQGQENRPITRDDGGFEGDAASTPIAPPLLIHPSRRSIVNSAHEREKIKNILRYHPYKVQVLFCSKEPRPVIATYNFAHSAAFSEGHHHQTRRRSSTALQRKPSSTTQPATVHTRRT